METEKLVDCLVNLRAMLGEMEKIEIIKRSKTRKALKELEMKTK